MDFPTLFLIIAWIVPLWLLGWLMLPLSRRVFVNLPDGGLAAGRILILVLVTLGAFWGASLGIVPLRWAPLWFLIVPAATSFWALRDATRRREMALWMRERRGNLVWSDAIFLVAFGVFLWVRLRSPSVLTFEKPMDCALLAAAMRADWLPFENPWLSGVPFTNYYYFGPLMMSLVARGLQTPPSVAYNLAQPMVCALMISALWSVCAALTRSPRRGLWAMSVVALLGHFEPLRQMRVKGETIFAPSQLDWWSTSRVIKDTINEYPAFTLLLGDAHAHFYALPLAALLFCLCWSLFGAPNTATVAVATANEPVSIASNSRHSPSKKSRKNSSKRNRHAAQVEKSAQEKPVETVETDANSPTFNAVDEGRKWPHRNLILTLIGLLLGVQVMTNTWDVPLFALLALGCAWWTRPQRNSIRESTLCMLPILLAPLVALPYLRRFQSQVSGVTWERWLPDGVSFALLWGGILGLWLLGALWFWMRHNRGERGAIFAADGENNETADVDARAWRLLMLLSACGFVALIAPCFFYIKGYFGDNENRRMDTVFKFGLQAWLLLGTAAGCGVARLWSSRGRTRLVQSTLISLPLLVAVLCSATVLWQRAVSDAHQIDGKFVLSLDGARDIPDADRKAIEWLRTHAETGDSVIEAVQIESDFYSYIGETDKPWARVSTLSGVASALGWPQHTWYWGADRDAQNKPRHDQIVALYQWQNDESALAALQELSARWIFVGALEQRLFPQGVARLRAALPVAYDQDGTFIVKVPQ